MPCTRRCAVASTFQSRTSETKRSRTLSAPCAPTRSRRNPPRRAAPPARAIAAASIALAPPDKPSLAVLPFANLNGDPTQDYFSDGLAIDIMAELVRIPGLFLISPDSAFTYKTAAARPCDVARKLGGPTRPRRCRGGSERPPRLGGALRPRSPGHLRRPGRDHRPHRERAGRRAGGAERMREPSASICGHRRPSGCSIRESS
jgi:hypothetical protein